MIPDTGSSNLAIASESCISCELTPRVPSTVLPQSIRNMTNSQIESSPLAFQVDYGTGGTTSIDSSVQFEILNGNLTFLGEASLIVSQNTSFGFNLFPAKPAEAIPNVATPTQDTCYNTYAGVLGLAYQGQGASAKLNVTTGPTRTNGTKTQLIDTMVRSLGMPNAFALEICSEYPYNCVPQRRVDHTKWAPSLEKCRRERVGHLMFGGYASNRLKKQEKMQYARLTDEIHYDVQVKAMTVCGKIGCTNVEFPDDIDGTEESDCMCKGGTPCTADTIKDPDTFEYCYFSVVESGAGRMYLNTPNNAFALLTAMSNVEMVEGVLNKESFWFGKSVEPNARIHPNASFHVHLAADSEEEQDIVEIPVQLDGGIFRHANFSADILPKNNNFVNGLIQWGIQGDMDVLRNYTAGKFPTLLGEPFFMGKTVFFDRSRRRIGFGISKSDICSQIARAKDIDVYGENDLATPGNGCRIGSGSGGGCP